MMVSLLPMRACYIISRLLLCRHIWIKQPFPPIQAEYAAESGGTMSMSTAQRILVHISEDGSSESFDQHKRTEEHRQCCLTT